MAIRTPAPLPSRAIYGYVLFVACYLGLALYLFWAYVPGAWLRAVGITYFPDKMWALALPATIVGAVVLFGTCLYPGVILLATPRLDDVNTVTDSHAVYVYQKPVPVGAIPPIRDVHISEACRKLYMND
ncbi:hypothetical protein HPB47_025156 [Ixodes persulcatus]|uniref:Uncharacterized protein n=1 Tax=Ixodes persulcatus TaxID=34615 RepID=A0AC60Q2S9_IXOPE|nr:hypothetical protein HPB47_025156 [Ixodes persulcatus]